MEPFQHEALDHTKPSIRLVEVLPNDGNLICCQIRHSCQGATYNCLSYMWGPMVGQRSIQVNGRSLMVRANLWDFLDIARRRFCHQPFWIDALCIDQTNNEERSHQVKQMGHIYSEAKLVVIWLGRGGSNDCACINFIQEQVHANYTKSNKLSSWRIRSKKVSKEPERMSAIHEYTSRKTFWDTFLKLCDNEYWRRAWIVQEITLARSRILLIGDEELDWSTLVNFWVETTTKSRFPAPKSHQMRLRNSPYGSFAASIGIARTWVPKSFHHVLRLYGNQSCSDTRDRVYSLLSLASDITQLPVDYNIDEKELFLRTLSVSGTPCLCLATVLIQSLEISLWKPAHISQSVGLSHRINIWIESNSYVQNVGPVATREWLPGEHSWSICIPPVWKKKPGTVLNLTCWNVVCPVMLLIRKSSDGDYYCTAICREPKRHWEVWDLIDVDLSRIIVLRKNRLDLWGLSFILTDLFEILLKAPQKLCKDGFSGQDAHTLKTFTIH